MAAPEENVVDDTSPVEQEEAALPATGALESPSGESEPADEVSPIDKTPAEAPLGESAESPAQESTEEPAETSAPDTAVEEDVADVGG